MKAREGERKKRSGRKEGGREKGREREDGGGGEGFLSCVFSKPDREGVCVCAYAPHAPPQAVR